MQAYAAEHLERQQRIEKGGYYTPATLVARVYDFIRSHLGGARKQVVVFDSAGGCGAFLADVGMGDYRIADCDEAACRFLRRRFDPNKVFCTNSLMEVSRARYSIPDSAFLIMIGNPPYNDTTSEFKHGEKGRNVCDEDLRDRDLGISFLRSYNKLNADVVCVLHPLSYLIKEANFRRLREFKDNYRLVRGEIFSSAMFPGTGSAKFPVLVALYARSGAGMTFDRIRAHPFTVMNSSKKFVLDGFQTTDGYINKYPPRKNDAKRSPLGLYYYSFRDINSLKRSASFIPNKHLNGVVVTLENFYQYAYLYSFKSLFNPKDLWLYGNLSPLVRRAELEEKKRVYVLYAIGTHPLFGRGRNALSAELMRYYAIKRSELVGVARIEKTIREGFEKLI